MIHCCSIWGSNRYFCPSRRHVTIWTFLCHMFHQLIVITHIGLCDIVYVVLNAAFDGICSLDQFQTLQKSWEETSGVIKITYAVERICRKKTNEFWKGCHSSVELVCCFNHWDEFMKKKCYAWSLEPVSVLRNSFSIYQRRGKTLWGFFSFCLFF